MSVSIFDFCKGLPTRTFHRDDVLLREGEKTGRLYILIDGWVEISTGGKFLNKVNNAGAIFGEVSVLLDSPHMATVKALEESHFYVIEDAKNFVVANSDLCLLLATTLAQRLSSVTAYLTGVRQSLDTMLKQQVKRPVSPLFYAEPKIVNVGTLQRACNLPG